MQVTCDLAIQLLNTKLLLNSLNFSSKLAACFVQGKIKKKRLKNMSQLQQLSIAMSKSFLKIVHKKQYGNSLLRQISYF